MSLQTVVKAGNITNLSDARYCAGMGVEIIGFPLGKSGSPAPEPPKIKEMMGWLSGVKIALELDEEDLEESSLLDIIRNLNPDYLQVSEPFVEKIRSLSSLPLLIVTDRLSGNGLKEGDVLIYTGSIRQKQEEVKAFCSSIPVILSGNDIDSSTILEVLKATQPYGIELKGGTEISPGLKSFEELSEILELLEVEE